jgi:hypothetical protein
MCIKTIKILQKPPGGLVFYSKIFPNRTCCESSDAKLHNTLFYAGYAQFGHLNLQGTRRNPSEKGTSHGPVPLPFQTYFSYYGILHMKHGYFKQTQIIGKASFKNCRFTPCYSL